MLLTTRNLALSILALVSVTLVLAAPADALTLDNTYGTSGTSAPIELPANHSFKFVDSVIRSDGSIAILIRNKNNKDFRIYSLTAEGKPDPAFGAAGFRVGDFADGHPSRPVKLAAYPDGRLVVAGTRTTYTPYSRATLVARFRRDGTQDRSFGKRRGKRAPVAVKIGVRGSDVTPGGIAVDRKQRVVVSYHATPAQLGTVRLLKNGLPDGSYGSVTGASSGVLATSKLKGTDGSADSLAVLPDGSAIIGGGFPPGCAGCGLTPFLLKIDSKGRLDKNFGPSTNRPYGYLTLPLPFFGSRVSIQATDDGKFYSAVNTGRQYGYGNVIDLVSPEVRRHLPNGTTDSAFSTDVGLSDPAYPSEAPAKEDLIYNGFSVSPAERIAVCGQDVRMPFDSPRVFNRSGFIQILDRATGADLGAPPANLLVTGMAGNPIDDCAWQSEGNLLVVDQNGNVTVSRYHP
jgi:hypothetical protein